MLPVPRVLHFPLSVLPALCPVIGLNCSESIKIVKKMESITVIRFWENLIEDIKKKSFLLY